MLIKFHLKMRNLSLNCEIMNIIKSLPLPASGLILATLSLGNLIQDVHPYLRYLFGFIGIIIMILLVLKVIMYPEDVKSDFENPVILSSCGTFSMAVMILSTYLIEYMPSISYTMWIIGLALHIMLMIYFTYRFIIRDFNINLYYPSYWIVFVGITMGAITANIHGLKEIGFLCFCIGFMSMLITTPLMIYRYINYRDIPDINKPLICIHTALFSILIVGYLHSAPALSIEFLEVLYGIAFLLYIFSLYKFIDYRNLDFYPSFSAFTFPFVISAIATKETSCILKIGILNNISTIETIIAVMLVVYVLIRYYTIF